MCLSHAEAGSMLDNYFTVMRKSKGQNFFTFLMSQNTKLFMPRRSCLRTHLLCEAGLQDADFGFYQLLEMVERVRDHPYVSLVPLRLQQTDSQADRQERERERDIMNTVKNVKTLFYLTSMCLSCLMSLTFNEGMFTFHTPLLEDIILRLY